MCKGISLSILIHIFVQFTDATKLLKLEDVDSTKISLLPEGEFQLNVSDKEKQALRYGFQKTQDCKDFEKAFICIRKCLDLNYQIAHADKNCICTCYKNTILAKYKGPIDSASTQWKLGAPTTSRPAWAGIIEDVPKNVEINSNFNQFVEDSKESQLQGSDGYDDEGAHEVSAATHDVHDKAVTDSSPNKESVMPEHAANDTGAAVNESSSSIIPEGSEGSKVLSDPDSPKQDDAE